MPLQFDQTSNQSLITFDPMDFQVLATEQNGYISGLLAGNGELMHDLELDVFGYAFLPELGAVDAGGFAFKDLHFTGTGDFAVDVGQHQDKLGSGC